LRPPPLLSILIRVEVFFLSFQGHFSLHPLFFTLLTKLISTQLTVLSIGPSQIPAIGSFPPFKLLLFSFDHLIVFLHLVLLILKTARAIFSILSLYLLSLFIYFSLLIPLIAVHFKELLRFLFAIVPIFLLAAFSLFLSC
jgi:hypothetical protein